MGERGTLGVVRGAALYVGALIGPGVLLVPALAAQAAGAASIVAWAALLVLSAPLAIVFAALGVRHPVAGGVAISVALPSRATHNWHPFAPEGWWAIGTAANILVWLFVGWEAVAQLAGDFRRPDVDLPRAIALAFGVVTVLYIGLAVATIGVSS